MSCIIYETITDVSNCFNFSETLHRNWLVQSLTTHHIARKKEIESCGQLFTLNGLALFMI